MNRIIHVFTDLCLALTFGVSIGASVAAATIFGVSRERGFDKHIANTLAGSMFDRLGWPMLVAAGVAMVGCLHAAKGDRPHFRRGQTGDFEGSPGRKWGLSPSRMMAGAAVLMFALACLTQFVFAPRMADLRNNSTWVNGELVDEAERAEFRRGHGYSMAVSGAATLIAGALIVGRRLAPPASRRLPPAA